MGVFTLGLLNFADSINGNSNPLLSATDAIKIIKVLEKAELSIAEGGAPKSI